MKKVQKIFNEKAEEFLKEAGLGKVEVNYEFYAVEDYFKATLIFYKTGEDVTINLDDDKDIVEKLANNPLLKNAKFIPVYKYKDDYNTGIPEFTLFDKERLEAFKNTFTILNETEIYNLWNEAKNMISKETFCIGLKNLTLEEFDRLEKNKKKIYDYIEQISKGELK